MGAVQQISLRGVRVHNLQGIDLDIPHRKLVVFCGLSGSGKSSLALDTLYAEGQRRYIESFSAYTRQFLQRLERPDAERIDGIPPAIAVTSRNANRSSRSTVGTATETADYLRLLYAKIGRVYCRQCGQEVRRDSPQSVAQRLAQLAPGTRLMVVFPLDASQRSDLARTAETLREDGFARWVVQGQMLDLSGQSPTQPLPGANGGDVYVVVDRLTAGSTADTRVRDSLETAFAKGHGKCLALVEDSDSVSLRKRAGDSGSLSLWERVGVRGGGVPDGSPGAESAAVSPHPNPLPEGEGTHVNPLPEGEGTHVNPLPEGEGTGSSPVPSPLAPNPSPLAPNPSGLAPNPSGLASHLSTHPSPGGRGSSMIIDGQPWRRLGFSVQMTCEDCGLEYLAPEPRLLSFNSPLGACPVCEGFGNVIDVDMDLVVPDTSKSIRDGAIAPWNSPAYAHELEELLALADDYGLPVDVPFRELAPEHVRLVVEGVPERQFGGLNGFFAWLERRKYKMHIRVFLSRWRSYRPCPACHGARLRPEALAVRVGGKNLAELSAMKIRDARGFLESLVLDDRDRQVGRTMLEQTLSRLRYLEAVGLGYITLDRTLRTLSGGELRRVALGSALGSSLVNMLYVLDEPSIGLHPRDIRRLIEAIFALRDRGNTVVVVEHEEAILRAADQVVEIGPGAGERGGRIVFRGTPQQMQDSPESLTGDYLAGRRGISTSGRRRPPSHGWIRLAGARGNNLKHLTVEFPLGVLCLVTGVSGSGKSTLVEDTLYPALCRRLRKDAPKPFDYDDVYGDGQIDDVVMVDQSPIGRTPRSNPVTYLKVFDEIRAVFAETVEAKTRGLTASHFSFNSDLGRCSACRGDGLIEIDMQFLADVYMRCSQCHGTRYRDEILEVTYRGRNIAEVLEMTVREAFTFFRGQGKVQARLKRLIDVGLDYIRLGQPANTLSGGEAQRLKLAGYTSSAKRGRCLFILDEPTTGLHFSDIVQLLDCFDALLAVGHSLVVVEHNLQVMKAADYIIDLGPGAADEGGQVVVQGTPEMVAHSPHSVTGRFLAEVLKETADAR